MKGRDRRKRFLTNSGSTESRETSHLASLTWNSACPPSSPGPGFLGSLTITADPANLLVEVEAAVRQPDTVLTLG